MLLGIRGRVLRGAVARRWCARWLALQAGAGRGRRAGLSARAYAREPGVAGRWGRCSIPVDDRRARADPLPRRSGSFRYISLADVVKDRVTARAARRARSRSIGTTAPGLLDLRSTPVGSVYPGRRDPRQPDRRACSTATIKQKPPYMLGAEVVLLLIGGVALALLIPMLSALWATLAAAVGRRADRRRSTSRSGRRRTWCCRSRPRS